MPVISRVKKKVQNLQGMEGGGITPVSLLLAFLKPHRFFPCRGVKWCLACFNAGAHTSLFCPKFGLKTLILSPKMGHINLHLNHTFCRILGKIAGILPQEAGLGRFWRMFLCSGGRVPRMCDSDSGAVAEIGIQFSASKLV